MNCQKNKMAALLIALSLLRPAIADTWYASPDDLEAQKRYAEAVQMAINGFATTARTPAEHLAEHRADLRACRQAFALLKNDKEFQNQEAAFTRLSAKDWIDALKASPHSKAVPIQYLIRNSSRFEIDTDFHARGMAANINEIYCHPYTSIRLLKIEALGASQEGWEIRKEVLNSLLSDLYYPYIQGGDGLMSFDTLFRSVLETRDIYKLKYGEAYSMWISSAASTIRRNSKNAREGTTGMTVKEQKQIIAGWAEKLLALDK